jgi:hypothetical protein
MPTQGWPLGRPALLGLVALACAPVGCATVSRNRLDDCRLRLQAVQAENEQLRDVALNVRNQNRDLSLRAVEDSRRLRAQDEAIARLEKSVMAYQEDRERTALLLDQLRTQVKTAASTTPVTAERSPAREPSDPSVRLASSGRSPSGLVVDSDSGSVRLPADLLFAAGSTTLTTAGEHVMDELGEILRSWVDPAASATRIQVVASATDSIAGEDRAKALWRHRARLDRVRVVLSERSGVSSEKITSLESAPADGEKASTGKSPGGDEWIILVQGRPAP